MWRGPPMVCCIIAIAMLVELAQTRGLAFSAKTSRVNEPHGWRAGLAQAPTASAGHPDPTRWLQIRLRICSVYARGAPPVRRLLRRCPAVAPAPAAAFLHASTHARGSGRRPTRLLKRASHEGSRSSGRARDRQRAVHPHSHSEVGLLQPQRTARQGHVIPRRIPRRCPLLRS